MGCSSIYRRGGSRRGAESQRLPGFARATFCGAAAFSLTLHDVAPATQARCARIVADVGRIVDAPFTLLVVPRYHHAPSTPAFERWVGARQRGGDELALHGLTHLDEAPLRGGFAERLRRKAYTAGEGEFAALSPEGATMRLDAGRAWFADRGWSVRGFVAPAWLLGPGAWQALVNQPFDYTCTLRHLVRRGPARAQDWRAYEAWSVVYSTRAAWRRGVALAWNRVLGWGQHDAPWIRFELHPGDFEFDAIRTATLRAIERAVALKRVALTLGEAADRLVGA